MLYLLYAATGIVTLALMLSVGVRPSRTTLSVFELRRLKELGDRKAEELLAREKLFTRLAPLRMPLRLVLLVVLTTLLVRICGWGTGLVIAVAVALLHEPITRFSPLRSLIDTLYTRHEKKLLAFIAKRSKYLSMIGLKRELKDTRPLPSSAEEVAHIIESSQVFSSDDTRLLKSALAFRGRLVKDSMTPKDAIVSIPYDELLGPLVLDGLHKTGHTLFPVMKGDDIAGILDSSGHVAVRDQNSAYVRDVMYTDSVKINQDATLDEALRLFLSSNQRLLIVIDDEAKTTGLLSLGDVVRALTGQKQ